MVTMWAALRDMVAMKVVVGKRNSGAGGKGKGCVGRTGGGWSRLEDCEDGYGIRRRNDRSEGERRQQAHRIAQSNLPSTPDQGAHHEGREKCAKEGKPDRCPDVVEEGAHILMGKHRQCAVPPSPAVARAWRSHINGSVSWCAAQCHGGATHHVEARLEDDGWEQPDNEKLEVELRPREHLRRVEKRVAKLAHGVHVPRCAAT